MPVEPAEVGSKRGKFGKVGVAEVRSGDVGVTLEPRLVLRKRADGDAQLVRQFFRSRQNFGQRFGSGNGRPLSRKNCRPAETPIQYLLNGQRHL